MYTIKMVRFQRVEEAKWEVGIMLDDKLIVDEQCYPVQAPIWDYKELPDIFSMSIGSLIKEAKQYCGIRNEDDK
ncbi:hypothetical protein [Brevibacillus sp. NRS-1366]|uniref:hypothetical protein n=1 Tax=Brevibacillus sp. NRS-1366 TaxID=3233899 RepID=UPI003D213DC9